MTKALTPARRARLEKLATYLEGLPKRYKHFDMGVVIDGYDTKAVSRYARENGGVASCGTVACAIGHGPAAGVLFSDDMFAEGYPNWTKYSGLFTKAINWTSDWCFGSDWEDVDNHHRGAAARIRYLLANGKPPEGYSAPRVKWRALYAPYRIDAKAQANA